MSTPSAIASGAGVGQSRVHPAPEIRQQAAAARPLAASAAKDKQKWSGRHASSSRSDEFVDLRGRLVKEGLAPLSSRGP
jgi:hypothetical protein